MAWLHFQTLTLGERSLYLMHEGHEMKLKFMTPRQSKKDQHTLKEKIEKERIEIEEKEKEVKKMIMEKIVEKQGV